MLIDLHDFQGSSAKRPQRGSLGEGRQARSAHGWRTRAAVLAADGLLVLGLEAPGATADVRRQAEPELAPGPGRPSAPPPAPGRANP
ncbi:hypothetical protein N7U49_14170 [Streptomyces sp. AD2-2]|nr:hypothetical protein N7U49_14170 [Streptomyces sp. AD2-2]